MYKISFSGLSLGHHQFDFQVDDDLFKTFDAEDIFDAEIHVSVDLEKNERFLKLDFEFMGHFFVPCDRCLDPLKIPIKQKESIVVNFGQENFFDDEIWVVSPKEHDLFLDKYIYETLVLLRPFSAMHNIEACNPTMLAQIQSSPTTINEPDDRWAVLKNLKNE